MNGWHPTNALETRMPTGRFVSGDQLYL